MSSSFPLSSPGTDAPGAGDLTTRLRQRLQNADASVIGFYEQSARTHRVERQSSFLGRSARL